MTSTRDKQPVPEKIDHTSSWPDSESELSSLDNFYRDLPGYNVPVKNDIAENDYAWLDLIDEDNCYMPLELSNSRPSKSLDFGKDGYTASLSTWHELLQMTAPDPECGLVFVRGDFPDRSDSILARAQRRNGKGTFGMTIKVPSGTERDPGWVQEATPVQGMINLRWPCTRLNWVRKRTRTGTDHFASFIVCSFVRDNTVYQIGRVVPKGLTQSSLSACSDSETQLDDSKSKHCSVTFQADIGGTIRFGCPSTAARQGHSASSKQCDKYTCDPPDYKSSAYVLSCTSELHDKRLEMRLWIDREPQKLTRHRCQSTDDEPGCRPEERFNTVVSLHALSSKLTLSDDKATIIVASFSLVNRDAHLNKDATKVIDYQIVQRYLGTADSTSLAPYRLWSAILGSSSGPDSFELKAVGRAVETILGVASLPMPCGKSPHRVAIEAENFSPDDNRSRGSTASGHHPTANQGVALLKNIITPQIVDLESMFWQVRLLVKAARLMNLPLQLSANNALPKDIQTCKLAHFDKMRIRYQSRIVNRVRDVCVWVSKLAEFVWDVKFLQDPEVGILASEVLPGPPGKRACKSRAPVLHKNPSSISNHKYYCSIIVWYVILQLPEVFGFDEPDVDVASQLGFAQQTLWWYCNTQLWEYLSRYKLPQIPGNSRLKAMDDPTGCILRWYHYLSLCSLCELLQRRDPQKFDSICGDLRSRWEDRVAQLRVLDSERYRDMETPQDEIGMLKEDVQKWQVKAEKSMRLFEQGRLSRRNLGHEAANLVGVGMELGVSTNGITALGKSCAEFAAGLIKARKPTEKLSPGRSRILRWDSNKDMRSAKPRPAPWELSCLAQFLPYNLDIVSPQIRDVLLDQCKEFMVSDYTFMASWDASKPTTVGHWWNFITSSVVCAKLLDNEIATRKAESERRRQTEDQTEASSLEKQKIELLKKIYACCRNDETRAIPTASLPVVEWKRLKPKMLYHSDAAARSFKDTQHVEKVKQNADINLRKNIRQFLGCNCMPEPAETLSAIEKHSGPSKLHNISCFDFFLTADSNELPEISEPFASGRADIAFWDEWATEKGDAKLTGDPKQKTEMLKLFRRERLIKGLRDGVITGSGIMDLYLIGNTKPIELSVLREHPLLVDTEKRENLLSTYQELLLSKLNNSLVDQGVKYRIIFAKHLSPATLQCMVYLWHPDAIDTFDDHLGDVSNFYDSTVQSLTGSEDTWVTGITIKHWRLLSEGEAKVREAEKTVEMCERKKRLDKLKDIGAKKTEEGKGEDAAQNWTDDGEKSPLGWDMKDYRFPPDTVSDGRSTNESPWGGESDPSHRLSMIHELGLSLVITGDETGRSWTYSIICELFDEKQVASYASEVAHTLQMFIHQQDAGRQLAFLLLLGYVCERLAEECECFMKALDNIMRYNPKVLLVGMKFGRSDQAVSVLKQMLWGFEALRIFNDKLSQAIDVVGKAEAKMYQLLETTKSVRHKDMISGVTQVKEEFEKRRSRLANTYTSLQLRVDQGIKLREGISSVLGVEQNESISRLTWLTIIYLGPGLLTGIFGMGHNIVPEDTDFRDFIWILSILVIGTILFAVALRFIIKGVKAVWEPILGRLIIVCRHILAAGERGWKWVKSWVGGVCLWFLRLFSRDTEPVGRHGARRAMVDVEAR